MPTSLVQPALGPPLGLAQLLLRARHLSAQSTLVPKPITRPERTRLLSRSALFAWPVLLVYALLASTGSFTVEWALWPIFFTIFQQAGSPLSAFAERHTDKPLFGLDLPPSWFQSVNPLYIVVLAPLFAALWMKLGSRNPSTTSKFTLALFGIGTSFLVMALAQGAAAGKVKVTPLWLIVIFLIQTVAELCLSPADLAASTQLQPQKCASQIVGLWFLAVPVGSAVVGVIKLLDGTPVGSLGNFARQGGFAIVAGAVLLACRPMVKRLMGDVS